jgi:hypothetical protein
MSDNKCGSCNKSVVSIVVVVLAVLAAAYFFGFFGTRRVADKPVVVEQPAAPVVAPTAPEAPAQP